MRRLSARLARTDAMHRWLIEDAVLGRRRRFLNRSFKGIASDAQRSALYEHRS